MPEFTLTDKQYEFISQFHELIEFAQVLPFRGLTDKITQHPEYIEVFEGMDWDDMIDRYEERPEYDKSFRLKVR